METIVDQLKTVNSKSFLNEIKNPSNITVLILKNFNNETNWDEISKFTHLNEIQLENCLIDNNIFFKAIAKIQSLTTLKYDYDCIIKKSDIKINLKIPQLNRIVFTLPSKDSPNLSMIDFYDRENELNNFINAFPNYPNAYQGLKEIELINYDIFLQNIKEKDYDYAYTGIYEGKDIFFQCDIYNLLRLKNLKNIKLTEIDEEIFEKAKGESESIAGFVLEIAQAFPKISQVIKFEGYQFVIESVDRKRIKRIKVILPSSP